LDVREDAARSFGGEPPANASPIPLAGPVMSTDFPFNCMELVAPM